MHNISRRSFVAGTAGAFALRAADFLPAPQLSGIEHVVVVTMENRSFDHFLGWLGRADGRQAGLRYPDRSGTLVRTYHLRDYQGCAHPDPDHSYAGGRIEWDNGKCDGWLRAGSNDSYAIGYYNRSDLPFLGPAALAWTTFSRYFAPTMAPTFPNRLYMHAAQTDRADDTIFPFSALPTIWDRLAAKGYSGRYYYSDVPFIALWGLKYLPIAASIAQFLTDCAAGTLPQVAFVDPRFLDEASGTSADDHPHADIRNGESFLNLVYQAVVNSPAWPNTVLVITYDEWGGFFEHISPQMAPDNNPAFALRGFRVPTVLVSPFARRDYVSRTVFDHTSILKLIEWRWGLDPLTDRDAAASNLALALQFDQPRLRAPEFHVPPGPFGAPCASTAAPLVPAAMSEWQALQSAARSAGWPI